MTKVKYEIEINAPIEQYMNIIPIQITYWNHNLPNPNTNTNLTS